MKILLALAISLCFVVIATAVCPYNDCHHPQWPTVQTGNCVGTTCNCLQGFGGTGCATLTGCPASCNNGTCGSNSRCACDTGYTGPLCDIKTCTDDCNGQGFCNNGVCDCYPGYSGSSCDNATVPQFQSAYFSNDWASLTLTFDQETDLGGMTNTACTSILDSATLATLGTGPKCTWETPSKLLVHLPHNATILPTTSDVTLISGAIKDVKGATGGITTGLTKTVNPAGSALTPVIKVSAPQYIGKSNDLIIDATMSEGLANRQGTFIWSAVSGTNITIADNDGYTVISAAHLHSSIVAPYVTTTIKISVRVRNSFGTLSALETITIIRKPIDIVSSRIDQPLNLAYTPGETLLSLNLKTNLGAIPATSTLSYKWTIYGATLGAALSYPTNAASLTFNKGVLTPGKTYWVQASAAPSGYTGANGTATITIHVGQPPLNAILMPSKAKAATGTGLGLTAQASVGFTAWGTAIPGRTFAWVCEKASSNTWGGSCTDATANPGTALTFPADDAPTKDFTIGGNVLSPGKYRFKYSVSATGHTTVTTEWSVITVVAKDSLDFVKSYRLQKPRMFNNKFHLAGSETVSLGYAIRIEKNDGEIAVIHSTLDAADMGRVRDFDATYGDAHIDLPIALPPMKGMVKFSPSSGLSPLTDITFYCLGFYQPGIKTSITKYELGSFGVSSQRVFKGNLAQGTPTLTVKVISSTTGVTKYTTPGITVGAPPGTESQQVDAVMDKLDTKITDIKDSADPDAQTAVVSTTIDILTTYDASTTLDAAAQKKMDDTRAAAVDLLATAATVLTTNPSASIAINIISTASKTSDLKSVKDSELSKLLTAVSDVISTSVQAIKDEGTVVEQSLYDGVSTILSKQKTVASKASGAAMKKAVDSLCDVAVNQIMAGSATTVSSTTADFTMVITTPTGARAAISSMPFDGVSNPILMQFDGAKPGNLGYGAISQSSFDPYNNTGSAIAGTSSMFFTAKLFSNTGAAITNVSDPTAGGATGATVSMSVTFKRSDVGLTDGDLRKSNMFSLLHWNIATVTYDLVDSINVNSTWPATSGNIGLPFENSGFSSFSVQLRPQPYQGLSEAVIAIIVVVGLVLIVVLGGLGYKYGPSLDKIRFQKRAAAGVSTKKGRSMLFYDPSAEPGEQWVQIAGAGAVRNKGEGDDDEKEEEKE